MKIKNILKAHRTYLLILLCTWGLYFVALFPRMIKLTGQEGLTLGHQNVWSDWALHIGIANIFAFKSPEYWFAYHPLYAGGKFTYPFMTNFISGMLMRFGLSLPSAFILPSIIFILSLLIGMYFLFYLLLRSRKQSFVAICIFLLSAGLGFFNFIFDFLKNPGWSAIFYPSKDYSALPLYDWYAGNVSVGLLIPQRAFLLGMTVGVWVFVGLIYVLTRKHIQNNTQRKILLISGLLAGIMPIVHAHTFIVLVLITGLICAVNIRRWRQLLWYVIPAGLLSSSLYYIFIQGGIENKSFMDWLPGWTSGGGLINWVGMWLQLWGAMIPVAIMGFFILRKKSDLNIKIFFLGCFAVFISANLILFQPIRWDNSKLFWWSYLGFSALASAFLAWLWHFNKKFLKLIAILIFILLTFTGPLEMIRLQRVDLNSFIETNAEDIRLGLAIRAKTDPLAVFLTAPQHNHFIMIWAARPILMGYTAWVWNYGFNYQQREIDMKKMYLGGDDVLSLLKKYKISYVAIGPTEINDLKANEAYYSSRFSLAFRDSSYRIYDTRSLLSH